MIDLSSFLLGLFSPLIGLSIVFLFIFALKWFSNESKLHISLPKLLHRKPEVKQPTPCPECGSIRRHKKTCSKLGTESDKSEGETK